MRTHGTHKVARRSANYIRREKRLKGGARPFGVQGFVFFFIFSLIFGFFRFRNFFLIFPFFDYVFVFLVLFIVCDVFIFFGPAKKR